MTADDGPDARVVLFRLDRQQRVAEHTSASSVVLVVLAGSGFVTGGDEERPVHAGAIVTYAPRERHGFRAEDGPFVVAAVIAPRPGSRNAS
jgi:quercetin dioxygenase-like cupin family protein